LPSRTIPCITNLATALKWPRSFIRQDESYVRATDIQNQAWTFGSLFALIGLLGVVVYAFVMSYCVRAQIENHANAISGRQTKIAKVAIDWGWTSHARLEGLELSNADWSKSDHMFKARAIEFDIRLWRCCIETPSCPDLSGDVMIDRQSKLLRPLAHLSP
jgi:hypothetical protein